MRRTLWIYVKLRSAALSKTTRGVAAAAYRTEAMAVRRLYTRPLGSASAARARGRERRPRLRQPVRERGGPAWRRGRGRADRRPRVHDLTVRPPRVGIPRFRRARMPRCRRSLSGPDLSVLARRPGSERTQVSHPV